MSVPLHSREEVPRLSFQLEAIAGQVADREVSLGELVAQLEGRVYTLLLVFLSLPFCQPISLPGISTPFGILIAILGLRFALRQKPWIPQRFVAMKFPSKYAKIFRGGAKLLRGMEKLLHPRLEGIFEYRATQFYAGATIFLCGLLLLLPLPVPFSNLLPALTVVLTAASFSERDGIMLAVGGGVFLITLAFFAAIFWGGAEAAQWINDTFRGFFEPGE